MSALDISSIYGPNLHLYCSNPIPLAKGTSKVGYHESVGLSCEYSGFTQIFAEGSFNTGLFFGSGRVSGNELNSGIGATINGKDGSPYGIFVDVSFLHAEGKIGIGNENISLSLIGKTDIGSVSGGGGLVIDPNEDTYHFGLSAGATAFSASSGVQLKLFSYAIEVGGSMTFLSAEYNIGIHYEDSRFSFTNSSPGLFGAKWYIAFEF